MKTISILCALGVIAGAFLLDVGVGVIFASLAGLVGCALKALHEENKTGPGY